VRVAVCGQSKRTAEAEGRENMDWEETLVRARATDAGGGVCGVCAKAWRGRASSVWSLLAGLLRPKWVNPPARCGEQEAVAHIGWFCISAVALWISIHSAMYMTRPDGVLEVFCACCAIACSM
jgi:hypothetical protein